MVSPLPYLIVVWAVGLYLLHVAVFYLVYLSMTDDAHGGPRPPSREPDAPVHQRAEPAE